MAKFEVDVPGLGELELVAVDLPRDSALRECEDLGRLPFSKGGVSRLVFPPTAASLFATWKADDKLTLKLVVKDDAGDQVYSAWLDCLPVAGQSTTVEIQYLTIPEAKMRLAAVAMPFFALEELDKATWLDVSFRGVVTSLRVLLGKMADGRTYNSVTPSALAEKLLYGSGAFIHTLVKEWRAFCDHAPSGGGVELLRKRVDDLDSATKKSPPKSNEQPLRALPDIYWAAWHLNMAAFQTINGLMRKNSAPFPSVDDSALVAGLEEQLSAVYQAVRRATDNTDVLGALVEARVRRVLTAWLGPLRLSVGAIAGMGRGRQIDGIIWDPTKAPCLIVEGEVAVVHPEAVRGILEIKTNTSDLRGFTTRLWLLQNDCAVYDKLPTVRNIHVRGLMIWSDDEYAMVNAESAGLVDVLLRRSPGESYTVNREALIRLIRFVYYGVHGHMHWRGY